MKTIPDPVAARFIAAKLAGALPDVRSLQNSHGGIDFAVKLDATFFELVTFDSDARLMRRADKIGLPYLRRRVDWSGSRKYGFRPVFSGLVMRLDHAEVLRATFPPATFLRPVPPRPEPSTALAFKPLRTIWGHSFDPEEDQRLYA